MCSSALPAWSLIAEREQLGLFAPDEVLTLQLDKPVPAAFLIIEIDGVEVSTPFGVSGSNLSLRIPNTLTGTTHDLVIYEKTALGRRYLGSWEFDLAGEEASYFVAIQAESGAVADETGSKAYTGFGGRLDFNINDGRFRGGLSFTRAIQPDPETGDVLSVEDIFLESKMALGGDDFYARIGSHYYFAEGSLVDEAARRGVSFRLVDPSSLYDVSVFALQPSLTTQPRNLSGLEDPDDLVLGFVGTTSPFPSQEVRLTFAGYDGYSLDLPSDKGGATNGYGVAISSPLFGGVADIFLSTDWSNWDDGKGQKSGRASTAELNINLLSPDDHRSLILGLGYSYIDLDYFSE